MVTVHVVHFERVKKKYLLLLFFFFSEAKDLYKKVLLFSLRKVCNGNVLHLKNYIINADHFVA